MTENEFYVYGHYKEDTDEIFYIGKGKNSRYKDSYGRNRFWKAIAKKHGWYAKILAIFATEDAALEVEEKLIHTYELRWLNQGPLVNFGMGGIKNAGRFLSEDTKKKMSASRMGRVVLASTRKKISIANKGKKGLCGDTNPAKRPEVAKKISDALRGIPKSDGHKKKLSAANLGKKRGQFSAVHKKRLSEAKLEWWKKRKGQHV